MKSNLSDFLMEFDIELELTSDEKKALSAIMTANDFNLPEKPQDQVSPGNDTEQPVQDDHQLEVVSKSSDCHCTSCAVGGPLHRRSPTKNNE